MNETVLARLETLPNAPGCYLFRDTKGVIVYVGKARNLRSRVRQYFAAGSTDYRYFVPLLEKVLGDIETIITSNEKEALILESTLIKLHKPRYNIALKDDKHYLSLRIDTEQRWPRVEVVRRATTVVSAQAQAAPVPTTIAFQSSRAWGSSVIQATPMNPRGTVSMMTPGPTQLRKSVTCSR
jgi:excinuclease UvrABC nuclease subunit